MGQKQCVICQSTRKHEFFKNSQSRACIDCDEYRICNKCGFKGTISKFSRTLWVCKSCYRKKDWQKRYSCWHRRVRTILKYARERARAKGLEFDIDIEWIKEELDKNDYRCSLSGIKLLLDTKNHDNDIHSLSLDRIDVDGDYTKDNVRITSSAVNKMRGRFTDTELFLMCSAIVEQKGYKIVKNSGQYGDFYSDGI